MLVRAMIILLSSMGLLAIPAHAEISITDGASDCGRRVTLRLEGVEASAFSTDAVAVVVQRQRASTSCSAMKQLVLKGYAQDKLVYQGIARAPRWQVRSMPILSGADAITAAAPPRPDPAKLPPVDGYRLEPMPERGTDCAARMFFNLQGPAPMTNDNERFVVAVAELAKLATTACPELSMLSLKPPPGSGSRFSFFSVRQQEDWLPRPVYAKLRDARQQTVIAQTSAMKARSRPTPATPNPLASRGFYAADKLGRGLDFTLYRAWLDESAFTRNPITVVVHDARAADAAIVPIRYTPARGQYLIGQAFIDEVNDTLNDAGEHVISVVNLIHYVDGVSSPMAPARNSSSPPVIERPLFESSFEPKRAAIYTIPQLGAARLLNIVTDPNGKGVLSRRGIYEGEPLGADNVLTIAELTGR